MKKISKVLGILLVAALVATVFVGAGAATFQGTSSSVTSSGSTLATQELLVPGQTLTAEVNFSFNVNNLNVGDRIGVTTAFSTPWEANVLVTGKNASYSCTLSDTESSFDCINIKHLASDATVKVTCTGIIPSSAKGTTITPLTATVSSSTSEGGSYSTMSLPVYDSGQLNTDITEATASLTALHNRVNNYYLYGAQNLGVSLEDTEKKIEDAETYLNTAKNSSSEKVSSGNIIRAKECVTEATTSLNKSALSLANKKLEEAKSLIDNLEAMNRDVKDLTTLYKVYDANLATFTTSTDPAKIDELIANLDALSQEATASINYDPMDGVMTWLPYVIIGVIAAIVALVVILLIRRHKKNSWDELG